MHEEILILGIGNVLLGDEGVGVHAVRVMEGEILPDHVRLLDGGTGGFHLLSIFQQYKKIILIDATLDGKKPGTVSLLKPKYAKDFPNHLSAHELGLKDLLDAAFLLGNIPEIYVVAISVKEFQEMGLELTPDVEEAIELAIEKVIELVKSFSD